MVSLKITGLAVVTFLSAIAQADYVIDADSVPISMRGTTCHTCTAASTG